jgi:cation:H+ antiporter
MLMSVAAIFVGFVLLVWGAERFVFGAAATARCFGVSPMIVGLTIVGFGTSAPELLVSGVAAWNGNPGLAIGNALGSNITNIALVLGVAALIKPLDVHSQALRRELPVLLLVIALGLVLLLDYELGRGDGLLLLIGLVLMVYWMVTLGLRSRSDPMIDEYGAEVPEQVPVSRAFMWLALGMVVLFVGSRLLVTGAVDIAVHFGVSDLVIGLTIIAIGTSLPELAATVMGALRNEHDIAVGNIIGSNMFNILGVMGLPGLLAPSNLAPEVLTRDYPLMIGLTLALFVMAYGVRGGHGRINRIEASLLIGTYSGYLYLLYRSLSSGAMA